MGVLRLLTFICLNYRFVFEVVFHWITLGTATGISGQLYDELPEDYLSLSDNARRIIIVTVILMLTHMLMMRIGIFIVSKEVMRTSNERVLNNFDQGVVLVQTDSNNILFTSKAAKSIHEDFI